MTTEPAPSPVSPAQTFEVMFGDNWPMLLDLVKTWAPVAIGAGLTLLAIQWVVGSVQQGRAPTLNDFDPGEANYVDKYAKNGKRRVTEFYDEEKGEYYGATEDGRYYKRKAGSAHRRYDKAATDYGAKGGEF